jgi:protein TonB
MIAGIPSGPGRYGTSDRVIGYAVLISLALHGALLFSFHMRPSKGRAEPLGPITAHLATPRPPAPQPEPPKVTPRVEPKPEPPKPRVERPIVKPAPVAKPSPIPVPRPAPAAPTPPEAAPVPAAPPQPSAPPAAGPPSPSAQTAPIANSEEEEARRAFSREIARWADRYKRYPRVARENNWEGRPVVRLSIGANGNIASIDVSTSSGHEVLDNEAQEMVKKAKGRVMIPPELRGKPYVVELFVDFELKAGQ